jgi:site-specific recombinase XerD
MSILAYEGVRQIVAEHYQYLNYSDESIKAVLYALRRFNYYLEAQPTARLPEKGRSKDYRDVMPTDLYGFMDYIEEAAKNPPSGPTRNIRKETLLGYAIRVKTAFTALYEEEKILQNPFAGVDTVMKRKPLRDSVLTEKEMESVLNLIDESTPAGFRNRAVLELLYTTGIRRKELIGLDLTDYFRDEKIIFIRQGKGKKDRIVPLGEKVNRYLSMYVKEIRPEFVRRHNREARLKEKALFLNSIGERLNRNTLTKLFDKLKDQAKEAEIFPYFPRTERRPEKGVATKKRDETILSPHVFRHTFATHLIQRGADVREVQLLLGHARVDSTEIYLNLSTMHLRETYVKYHPLENELFFDVKAKESYIFEWAEARLKEKTNI